MIVIIVVVVSILALTELYVALRNWESVFGLRSPFLFFVFCELNWLRSVPQSSKTDSSRLRERTTPSFKDSFRAEHETSR